MDTFDELELTGDTLIRCEPGGPLLLLPLVDDCMLTFEEK
jgi:hypothetical protein